MGARGAQADLPRQLAIAADDVGHEQDREVAQRLREELLPQLVVRVLADQHLDDVVELRVGDALADGHRRDALLHDVVDEGLTEGAV